jgi:hypothetical protein
MNNKQSKKTTMPNSNLLAVFAAFCRFCTKLPFKPRATLGKVGCKPPLIGVSVLVHPWQSVIKVVSK